MMAVLPGGAFVVADEEAPCPYLSGQTARMPLRVYPAGLSPEAFDEKLALGDRRMGPGLYRTECPSCRACEPLRVPVSRFRASASQRRVARRNADVRATVGPVVVDEERVALFNRHKRERGLARGDGDIDAGGYAAWFAASCARTVEIAYRVGPRLVGAGIVDLGARDGSSVYFFFDPDESRRSLGTFSVLTEIAWLRARGGRFLYLGLYVAACGPLAYKARFTPHERLLDGRWTGFAAAVR